MAISEKKLTLDDLSIGMRVKASQLSDILDTYIVLTDAHLVKNTLGIEHDLVVVELDNDRSYMNIPIMLYGKPIMEYFTDKFIDNLKHLINIWGTNPFCTLLERNS